MLIWPFPRCVTLADHLPSLSLSFIIGTIGLDLVPLRILTQGSGTNQGSPGWCPGPQPLEALGQFFCLIKSAQWGCTAFELIHAESVMQSRRDGQLA